MITTGATATAALALALAPGLVQATSYSLVKEYSGSSFFNDWTFYGNFDNLTNGDAIFVTKDVATSANLAFVNSAGNAIIKVDNTTTVPFNDKRNTVRISSDDSYSVGSVWVADMLHVPYGCSVWPAFWSQAPAWPSGGEIDTFEGVNLVTHNQMALHTEPGCTVANAVQTSTLVNSTDCSFEANSNQGCVVTDPSTASYGQAFAAAGGGVFVTEFATSGISIWIFSICLSVFRGRSNVPSSLSGSSVSSVDTSTLGTPTANYPSTSCSSSEFFSAQHLIFDITLCGDFAGNNATFAETCSGTCYNDYVIGPASGYDNAYFEVQNVRVFGNSSTVVSSGGNSDAAVPALGSSASARALVAGVLAAGAWFLV
ncbi:concanavalin A-like lectin/glucanase domain-containing protein [Amylostereum chailletii]|nr:concanavalin A-like lectin/glucanase domain-containing protein [Amylostereum chailletii]